MKMITGSTLNLPAAFVYSFVLLGFFVFLFLIFFFLFNVEPQYNTAGTAIHRHTGLIPGAAWWHPHPTERKRMACLSLAIWPGHTAKTQLCQYSESRLGDIFTVLASIM